MGFLSSVVDFGKGALGINASNKAASMSQFKPINWTEGMTDFGTFASQGDNKQFFSDPRDAYMRQGALSLGGGLLDMANQRFGQNAYGVDPLQLSAYQNLLSQQTSAIPGAFRNQDVAGLAADRMNMMGGAANADFNAQFWNPNMRISAQGDLSASSRARQALGNFDPDQYASTQFERLNALARPGEETATSSAFNNLFGSGRLGTSGGARDMGQLDLSQRMARDARLGQAIGLAGTESDRLANRAIQFGQLAGNKLGYDEQFRQGLFNRAQQGMQSGFEMDQAFTGQQRLDDVFRRQRAGSRFDAANIFTGLGAQNASSYLGAGTSAQTLGNLSTNPAFSLANLSLGQAAQQATAGANAGAFKQDAAKPVTDIFTNMLGGFTGGLFG